MYDVSAALGKLYQTGGTRFRHSAKVKKINKKPVDISESFSYINITNKNEHELGNNEHGLVEKDSKVCDSTLDMLQFTGKEVKAR